jgi:hypothetical protein
VASFLGTCTTLNVLLIQAPHREDVCRSGGIDPHILKLGTDGGKWSASMTYSSNSWNDRIHIVVMPFIQLSHFIILHKTIHWNSRIF